MQCCTGGVGIPPCGNKWIALLLYPGGKVCFDTFIAISCWFWVDQSFKTEKFLKIYLEVMFYSVVTTIVALVLGSELSVIEIFGSFLLIVLGLFCFVFRFVSSLVWSEQSVYCRLILFVFIYFLVLYIKRNPLNQLQDKKIMAVTFLMGWLLIFGYHVAATIYPELPIWRYIFIFFLCDEGGILYIITGLAFFFLFKSIQIKPNRIINKLASVTLGVLLIHDGHFSRGYTWSLLHTTEWFYVKTYFVRIIACAIGIYLVCALIDIFRKRYIETPVFKSKYMKALCSKGDEYLTDSF